MQTAHIVTTSNAMMASLTTNKNVSLAIIHVENVMVTHRRIAQSVLRTWSMSKELRLMEQSICICVQM